MLRLKIVSAVPFWRRFEGHMEGFLRDFCRVWGSVTVHNHSQLERILGFRFTHIHSKRPGFLATTDCLRRFLSSNWEPSLLGTPPRLGSQQTLFPKIWGRHSLTINAPNQQFRIQDTVQFPNGDRALGSSGWWPVEAYFYPFGFEPANITEGIPF